MASDQFRSAAHDGFSRAPVEGTAVLPEEATGLWNSWDNHLSSASSPGWSNAEPPGRPRSNSPTDVLETTATIRNAAGGNAGAPPDRRADVTIPEKARGWLNLRSSTPSEGATAQASPAVAAEAAQVQTPAQSTSAAGWQCVTDSSSSRRLWRYVLAGQSPSIDTSLDTHVVVHGWLGSGVNNVPTSPLGFNAGLTTTAVNLASSSRQVLFLDWGLDALEPNPAGLAPYKAAGQINQVALWAKTQLQSLVDSGRSLTLAGFSLGSYVAAQTAVRLGSGPNLKVVAMDPAASGLLGPYDLDLSNSTADPVPNLASTAPSGSLAFVVTDSNVSTGLAGDNSVAGTAQRSFLVKGFSSSASASIAHGAIPRLYGDLARYLTPNAGVTERILGGFRSNQYNNSGSTSGTRLHEGLATVRSDLGAIARLEGLTATGASQTVEFVDSLDSLTPTGSSTRQDTIVTLRNLQLASTASIEWLVLGGSGDIGATGNNAVQDLIGNSGANRLEGRGGLDKFSGGGGVDSFVYAAHSDALVGGSSTQRSFEWITDFDASQDRIDAPGSTRTISNLGSVASLSDTGLRALLTAGNFAAGAAALFRSGSGASERLFLGLNDSSAGFDPLRDAIVELTGLKGAESAIMVI